MDYRFVSAKFAKYEYMGASMIVQVIYNEQRYREVEMDLKIFAYNSHIHV